VHTCIECCCAVMWLIASRFYYCVYTADCNNNCEYRRAVSSQLASRSTCIPTHAVFPRRRAVKIARCIRTHNNSRSQNGSGSFSMPDCYTHTIQYKKFKWSHRRNGRYTPGPLVGARKVCHSTCTVSGAWTTHIGRQGGTWPAPRYIPVSISATAAQWRSEQHTAADRVRAHGGAASSAS